MRQFNNGLGDGKVLAGMNQVPSDGQTAFEVQIEEVVQSLLGQPIGGDVGQDGYPSGEQLGQLQALHVLHRFHVPVASSQPNEADERRQHRQEVVEVQDDGLAGGTGGHYLDAIEEPSLSHLFDNKWSDPLLLQLLPWDGLFVGESDAGLVLGERRIGVDVRNRNPMHLGRRFGGDCRLAGYQRAST